MEYFTVKAISGGFLAICVKGRDLSILKSMNKRTYLPLFRKCFSHQVLCCFVEELRVNDLSWVNQASAVKDFNVAVGLSDGSVILVNVWWDGAQVYDVILLSHPVGVLHCGAGFVFASSISGECALLYAEPSSACQFIRMDVNLVPKVTGMSLWQRSQCSVPSTVTSFPTHNKGCSADMQEQQDLVVSYFDESASLLNSVSSVNASSTNAKIPESELLLIGCTDGTLWWLQTPSRSSVLELYTDDTDSMDENDARRLPAQLVHTFHTSVQRILFTGLSLRPEKNPNELAKLSNCVTSICVVECSGKATLLGMSSSTSKSTRTFQFPAHCNLSSILYYDGVFLYIDDRSGMLCAISVDTAPHTAYENTRKSAGIARVIEHILTPTTSPRILSYSILTTSTTNNAQRDMILLRINDGALVPITLPFENSDSGFNTMEVIAALQRACGGGTLRHPFTLAPVQVHTSIGHSDPQVDSVIVTTAGNSSAATTNDTELAKLEHAASQLCEVGEENENILKQILQADLEVLQLTALLQELPGTLQILCGDNKNAKAEYSDCAVLSNPTRSIQMHYRFRTEPAPHSFACSSSSNSDKCTYMDISISAHSVQAMRALQGRTMTISVQSTFGTTSLHCSSETSTVQILLQPVLTSGVENINNTCEYEYTTTISMDHLNQLSSFRLVISVLVDAPRAISTACSDKIVHVSDFNSTMLCIVDHIIPLSEVLLHILPVCNDSTLTSLQHLCESHSTDRTEYTLTINPSTADSHSIINAYQRAIDKNTQYADHQYNAALRSDNLLQAAFLPHMESDIASTNDAASTTTAAFHLGSDNVGLGTTRIGSHAQSRRRAQKQQLTLSFAQTAPNVTGTGGATSTQKHTLNTNRISMNNSSNKANDSQRVSSVASAATSARTPIAQNNSALTQSSNSGNGCTSGSVTISSNSAALLASIASEVHASELRDISTCSNGLCMASADFTDADAAYLDAELQQMMVQAAHMVRENDPATCVENKTLSSYDDANVGARMWTIYSSLRKTAL